MSRDDKPVKVILSPPLPSKDWGDNPLDEMRGQWEIEVPMESINSGWWLHIPILGERTLRYKMRTMLPNLDQWVAFYEWDERYPYVGVGPQPPEEQ